MSQGVRGRPPLPLDQVPCCDGEALYDTSRCTCFEPEHDRDQLPPLAELFALLPAPQVQAEMCGDCACRSDSPEYAQDVRGEDRGMASSYDRVLDMAIRGVPFFCHQGMRRILGERHPDGRWHPFTEGAYGPRILELRNLPFPLPLQADGTPARICGGWAAHARKAGHDWFDAGSWPKKSS